MVALIIQLKFTEWQKASETKSSTIDVIQGLGADSETNFEI